METLMNQFSHWLGSKLNQRRGRPPQVHQLENSRFYCTRKPNLNIYTYKKDIHNLSVSICAQSCPVKGDASIWIYRFKANIFFGQTNSRAKDNYCYREHKLHSEICRFRPLFATVEMHVCRAICVGAQYGCHRMRSQINGTEICEQEVSTRVLKILQLESWALKRWRATSRVDDPINEQVLDRAKIKD